MAVPRAVRAPKVVRMVGRQGPIAAMKDPETIVRARTGLAMAKAPAEIGRVMVVRAMPGRRVSVRIARRSESL